MGASHRRKRIPLIEEDESQLVEPVNNPLIVEEEAKTILEPVQNEKRYAYPPLPNRGKKKSRVRGLTITVGILVILGFVFGMMTLFTSAKVTIVPKSSSQTFNLALTAYKNLSIADSSATSTPLRYEILDLTKDAEVEVPASGEEMAENKAEGTIIIYNNFSSEPQRLITRTRFESSTGLIYRIQESIVVPGKTASGPGMIEALVVAEEAGDKYNVDKSDFTVPGFKDDAPRYAGFYAKSKTAMAGGFVGRIKKVSASDKQAAISGLENSLRSELEKEYSSQVPEGFVALRGGSIYEFKDLGQTESTDTTVKIKVQAIARVIILDKQTIARAITAQYLPEWSSINTEIRSFDAITMILDENTSLSSDIIKLSLVGSSDIYATIDGLSIAEKLAGLAKNDIDRVLSENPGVYSASASVSPVWKQSFPDDPKKIHINVD